MRESEEANVAHTVEGLMEMPPPDRERWALRSVLRLQSNADSEKDKRQLLRDEIMKKFDDQAEARATAAATIDGRLRKIEYALVVLIVIMAGREGLALLKLGL